MKLSVAEHNWVQRRFGCKEVDVFEKAQAIKSVMGYELGYKIDSNKMPKVLIRVRDGKKTRALLDENLDIIKEFR